MATIKAIEAQSVHQIQSGQVIVDLCSVVKELVENGLDAGANSIEVRFKNNGLDSIEVQDNGSGISAGNYESVALKHHTSKLSSYDDLSSLDTFGFRGEALSSLCALSTFYIMTSQAEEAPKGKRLDFEVSGRLKSTSVVACQRGTTATVENLFEQLPVRRKELSKNIKREYGKVVGLLHAYACICTGVRFSVKNIMPKGKSVVAFSTKANATTRENIANVYGAKTIQALLALDLDLDFQPTLTQISRKDAHITHIKVSGHISRPVFGEGRQTPDRQMLFVNGRPCGLPQIAKAINEVYKSFNVSQSPFVFADFQMDTNAYDVNVSPDKRTILLHNATALIEKLKESLNELFEKQEQTVPQSQAPSARLPVYKQLSISRMDSAESPRSDSSAQMPNTSRLRLGSESTGAGPSESDEENNMTDLIHDHFRNQASTREETPAGKSKNRDVTIQKQNEKRAEKLAKALAAQAKEVDGLDKYDVVREIQERKDKGEDEEKEVDEEHEEVTEEVPINPHVQDFNKRMAEQYRKPPGNETDTDSSVAPEVSDEIEDAEQLEVHQNMVQNAFDRMRPQRNKAELATITIGDMTTTTIIGSGMSTQKSLEKPTGPTRKPRKEKARSAPTLQFSQALRRFDASTQADNELSNDNDEESESIDDEVNGEDVEISDSNRSAASALPFQQSRSSEGQISCGHDDSDDDYIEEAEVKAAEEERVAELIRAAEESAMMPSKENMKRANKVFRTNSKDATTNFEASVHVSLADLEERMVFIQMNASVPGDSSIKTEADNDLAGRSDEEKLSLTISKHDFAEMEVIGQFNLGFILAVRRQPSFPDGSTENTSKPPPAELFIIDQHASDEKFNFERLQASTAVSNQQLVRPITLDLTAVEEEIVLENLPALEKNGFVVEIDTDGDEAVGQRCKLLTLPLSKEVTFDTRDLDELIHLLAESPTLNSQSQVPRPEKVRKMFAMRACRSSVMIGQTLSKRQMEGLLKHMGEIDKPWNCPHGRPTMRHLTSLKVLGGWSEWDGFAGGRNGDMKGVWAAYGK